MTKKRKEEKKTQTKAAELEGEQSSAMTISNSTHLLIMKETQSLVQSYVECCTSYRTDPEIGVLCFFRFGTPDLCASASFVDKDALPFVDTVLSNTGRCKQLAKLDFRRATLGSHGVLSISNLLTTPALAIKDLRIQYCTLGSHGALSIALALAQNTSVTSVNMRQCHIGSKGTEYLAEHLFKSKTTKLKMIDLSINNSSWESQMMITEALQFRQESGLHPIEVEFQGNILFAEVMNAVTHCVGTLLSIGGTIAMLRKADDAAYRPCLIYCCSLCLLYLSSTLYHSFFTFTVTRDVFSVFDQAAIYILIAGSYTPFLQIPIDRQRITTGDYAYGMTDGVLAVVWLCCVCGVGVEAVGQAWAWKGPFSLTLYLVMGWMVVLCGSQLIEAIPQGALVYLVLGGLFYTGGVPFFVRNKNLDHAIWHLFVLAGSVAHFIALYGYIV